jgi:hypothetical protein
MVSAGEARHSLLKNSSMRMYSSFPQDLILFVFFFFHLALPHP